MSGQEIFNQAALDKLRSPEKLDKMIRITGPVWWMGLAAVAVLCLAVVLWSIYGSLTDKAEGYGLITDSAGIANVTHASSGKISKIYVKTGSAVHKGQIVARMEQADESAQTLMARQNTGFGTDNRDLESRIYEYDVKRYQQNIHEDVISEYEGIVDEIMVMEGEISPAGSPICSVRITQGRKDVTGVFYVPVDNGKQIEPGMTIQLAPNGVDVSQTGSLIGVVRRVSEYPISLSSVKNGLGNEQLANYVLNKGGGAVIGIKFDLVRDADSESGYLWTSVVGKHQPVMPGSFVTGFVVIDREPPIEKAFYKISQLLRNR